MEVKIWPEEMRPYLDRIELAGPPERLDVIPEDEAERRAEEGRLA
jgi:hypothetical protein